MKHLIIGANSLIGSALINHIGLDNCIGLTRKELDLAKPISTWPKIDNIKSTIICAGITSQKECRDNPKETSFINVTQTLNVADWFGVSFVIFLSSHSVFDITSEYGRQKQQAEHGLLQTRYCAIVRLTDVIHANRQPFKQWKEQLDIGSIVHPFKYLNCSPLSLSCVVKAIATLADKQLPGIWELSGAYEISYVQIAQLLSKQKKHLVIPTECPFNVAKHTPLNSTNAQLYLDFVPPEPRDVLLEAFA